MYKTASCRERWNTLRYAREQCLKGLPGKKTLWRAEGGDSVQRDHCAHPHAQVSSILSWKTWNRPFNPRGDESAVLRCYTRTCGNVTPKRSDAVVKWTLIALDFFQKTHSHYSACRGFSEHVAWLDWWDRSRLKGGSSDWKELDQVSQKRVLHTKLNLQKSLLQSFLKELCRLPWGWTGNDPRDLYIEWFSKLGVVWTLIKQLVESLGGPCLKSKVKSRKRATPIFVSLK